MENGGNRAYFGFKLRQAREACEEAEGLLADNAELRYVVNSVYYAYYYPVLALLDAAGHKAEMQSVSIAFFEKLFKPTGLIEDRFFLSLRKAFDLKPKCTDPAPKFIDRSTAQELLRDAQDFCQAVETAALRAGAALADR